MPNRPRKRPDPLADAFADATARGDLARTHELLAQGAEADAKTDRGPLICAVALDRRWEIVLALTHAGADVNARDRDYGYTPLHWAVLHGDLTAVCALRDLGADPRVRDRWGNMPLNTACSGIGFQRKRLDPAFCRQVATRFLAAGCDLDDPNASGNTPRKIALDPVLNGPVADLFRDMPPHGQGSAESNESPTGRG